MNNILKREGESHLAYAKRLTENKREYDLDYQEWSKLISGYECSSDNARKGYYLVKKLLDQLEEERIEVIVDSQPQQAQDELLMELEMKKRELYKERVKLRDERNERNKFYTVEARWENIVELLKEYVVAYEPKVSDYIARTKYQGSKNEACLLLSDWHIGSEIWTFHNKFNLDIAKGRINKLKECVIE